MVTSLDRPDIQQTLSTIARAWGKRSTCPRAEAGCLIVDDRGFVLSSGFNGSPSGSPHCIDVGCLIDGNHCVRAIHAEANAVITAARYGVKLKGAVAYCTLRPCLRCLGILIQAGIREIYYEQDYFSDSFQDSLDLCKATGCTMTRVNP